jgi:hypothetical protein
VTARDRRQRGDEPRVDQAAAQVRALEQREHDPVVAQDPADGGGELRELPAGRSAAVGGGLGRAPR